MLDLKTTGSTSRLNQISAGEKTDTKMLNLKTTGSTSRLNQISAGEKTDTKMLNLKTTGSTSRLNQISAVVHVSGWSVAGQCRRLRGCQTHGVSFSSGLSSVSRKLLGDSSSTCQLLSESSLLSRLASAGSCRQTIVPEPELGVRTDAKRLSLSMTSRSLKVRDNLAMLQFPSRWTSREEDRELTDQPGDHLKRCSNSGERAPLPGNSCSRQWGGDNRHRLSVDKECRKMAAGAQPAIKITPGIVSALHHVTHQAARDVIYKAAQVHAMLKTPHSKTYLGSLN
ncbi:hypothetical protein RRG08_065625 [Elysia crispata]|uniref:Uncharacterized protein n=1 Tax=Elysia crispata TaxID=231223 RepID=A0AAE0YNA6_9GAST|nr:hypothetical protein RRG08_065625 [Elysia crispata]